MAKITILTSRNCLACSQVKNMLGEIKTEQPQIDIEEVDIDSSKGKHLSDDLGILSLPALLINNQLFSTGFIAKEEVVKHIKK